MATEPIQKTAAATMSAGPINPPSKAQPSGLKRGFWTALIFYVVVGFFLLNLIAMVSTVVLDSVGQEWFSTWFPTGMVTFQWYKYALNDHDIVQLLLNTLIVAVGSTGLSIIVGFPAAYVLARKKFRLKSLVMGLYLLPMLVPPLAYGIPLATVLLRYLGGELPSVTLINVVPTLPFVILILVPFIEQVDVSLESASRMLGANRFQTFIRIILPLIVPGLLTAGVLAVVRVIAMFELTYLVASADAETLVVTLYGDAFASGMRPEQAINSMAVIYMLTTMFLLGVALIFVKPTQFVVRLKQ
ncbi:ABC transporter permease [Reticulibacter mediterranei]|uniref:ABC transporter permease n=1 Tax=Reticulibacter mediterranei TaxID=2778369 RepID=A0A8J3IM46_9CHLR|nr:ABC transporter permease subunit [Reticulibacter mediterranei]GHO93777.1 ABC transporter permease [Reticulibacter mediterranei]